MARSSLQVSVKTSQIPLDPILHASHMHGIKKIRATDNNNGVGGALGETEESVGEAKAKIAVKITQ